MTNAELRAEILRLNPSCKIPGKARKAELEAMLRVAVLDAQDRRITAALRADPRVRALKDLPGLEAGNRRARLAARALRRRASRSLGALGISVAEAVARLRRVG